MTNFKKILKWCGITNIPHVLTVDCIKSLSIRISDHLKEWFVTNIFLRTRNEAIGTGKKLRTYFKLKHQFCYEKYLNIQNDKLRRYVTKLRVSNHNLPIERGRYNNISVEYRLCNMCGNGDIGDEFHLLMTCDNSNLCKLRVNFLVQLRHILQQIEYLSLDSLFVYAFSLIDTNIFFLAARYIADCMIILDEHISRRN